MWIQNTKNYYTSNIFDDLKYLINNCNLSNIDYINISFLSDPSNIYINVNNIEILKEPDLNIFEVILNYNNQITYLDHITDIKKYVNENNFLMVDVLKNI